MNKKSLGAKTLATPAPVWLVGTYDKEGQANIATIAWGGTCCSDPPAVCVSLRKARHSYQSIIDRKAFTVSIPSEAQVVAADYAGIASGAKEDKFATAGLTAVRSGVVDAPYVAECPLVLECRLLHTVEIGVHIQFIGEIVDVKANEDVINAEGLPDGLKVRPIIYDTATRNYHGLGEIVGKGFVIGKELMK